MLRPEVIAGDDEDGAVYNNMRDVACTRSPTSNIGSACFSSWSWDETKCTDMLPFSLEGRAVRGMFMQVSSLAMSLEVTPGSLYELSFPSKCSFVLRLKGTRRAGSYNWTRASRTSPTDGKGGNNIYGTLELTFDDGGGGAAEAAPLASSVWIAREREQGSLQSNLGIATFVFQSVRFPR